MTPGEHYLKHLQRTFILEKTPDNVRLHDLFLGLPVLRRLARSALSWPLVSAEGCFFFQNQVCRHKVFFNGRNLQFHALYEPGYRCGYELESALTMMTICSGEGSFFDVGSNWGYFSLLMASLDDFNGPIYAFEPNPKTFADLTGVICQAGLKSRVQAMNFGIGGINCQMSLCEPDPLRTGLASLSAAGDGPKIIVKPLDELNLPAPRLIKIDAEGMEAEVLRGMEKTLEAVHPFVLFENFLTPLNPAATFQPLEILSKHGYLFYVPALLFQVDGRSVPATYAADFNSLLQRDARPAIGLFEVRLNNRFFLGNHLNLLAVHHKKIDEVWALGIKPIVP